MTPLQLLQQLVAIPSVNPMGQPREGSEFLEGRLSEFLVDHFQQRGISVERSQVAPGRDNVIAWLPGSAGLPTVLLDAHQDTVPVDDMTIEPFVPLVSGGRVQGRGACDVKGGMAAMISAFTRFAAEAPVRRPTVIMASPCDEEYGELGVLDLVRSYTEVGTRPPCFEIILDSV